METNAIELNRAVWAGGFAIREYRLPADFNLLRHEHDGSQLILMLGGSFRGAGAGEDYAIEGGDAIVAPPAGDHRGHAAPASGSRAILIEAADQRRARVVTRSGLTRFARHDDPETRRTTRTIDRELSAPDDSASLALEAAVLGLVAHWARRTDALRERHTPPWISRTRERLDAAGLERVTLTELAAEAGVSPAHLQHEFRRAVGCSVGRYHRARRLDRAAVRLRTGDDALTDIALGAGFYDQSHFTNAFRRQFGITPARYRKKSGG